MEYDTKMFFSKETMPQTVPSGIYSPDTYAAYAENFDLSLLSMDNEDSLRHTSQSDYLISDYTPTTIYQDPIIKLEKSNWTSESLSITNSPLPNTSELLQRLQLPTTIVAGNNQQFNQQLYYSTTSLPSEPSSVIISSSSSISFQPPLTPPLQEQFITVFPPSPAPSIEQQQQQQQQSNNNISYNIKQEYICGLFPPSPPDSNGAPSPRCCDIKSEPDTEDIEASIDIDSLLQKSFEAFEPKKQDHQLLREYLQDTSFQRKHNLKPLALESLLGGWGARGDIEPVISLALEHAKRDIQQTCATLNISSDPQQWTREQVRSWLQSTITQYKLAPVHGIERLFPEDGVALSRLTDDEFVRRLPQAGGTLHAQLEVWKAACNDSISSASFSGHTGLSTSDTVATDASGSNVVSTATTSSGSTSIQAWNLTDECPSAEASDDEDEEMPTHSSHSIIHQSGQTSTTMSTASTSSDTVPVALATKPVRQGGSHIHLWQFLKELLAAPQLHGTSIRWLDRSKGVFKIEDSVRVARLWGRRKNRPAMNYDKLSRSIRQYYKKGIMKKTERSQRLVYQFCHPYNL